MRGVVGSLALNYKFTADSAGEIIFKIGQLVKLHVRIWMGVSFYGTRCICNLYLSLLINAVTIHKIIYFRTDLIGISLEPEVKI